MDWYRTVNQFLTTIKGLKTLIINLDLMTKLLEDSQVLSGFELSVGQRGKYFHK